MSPETGSEVSLRFCAMQYINVWCGYDRKFVEGLQPGKSIDERVQTLRQAATFYRIARNFKAFSREDIRKKVLRALDSVSERKFDIDGAVHKLASDLEKVCGKQLISAASKLLWFRCRSPVVILDRLALLGLRSRTGAKHMRSVDYHAYREEWRRQFKLDQERVRAATDALMQVTDFSLAYGESRERLASCVTAPWFQERVFDQFLWWTGKNREELRHNGRLREQ